MSQAAGPGRDPNDLYRSYEHTVSVGEASSTAASLFVRAYLGSVLAPLKASTILELGAGTGEVTAALRALGYDRVMATDASPAQVERARAAGVDVDLLDGRMALERCGEGSLGAVVALDVLEHLPVSDAIAWMRLAHDRLGPGGLVAIRVPNGEGIFGGSIRYGDITHVGAFTELSLRQLFGLGGFADVRVVPCRPIPHGVASAARAAVWRCIELVARVMNLAESGRWSGAHFTRNIFAVARRSR